MSKYIFLSLFLLFAANCFAQVPQMPRMPKMPKMPTIQQTQQTKLPIELAIDVKAGNIWSTPFVINQDEMPFKVGFEVAEQRDIIIFLTDAVNYKKFLEGRKFLVNYQSDKVESGLIDIKLPRGQYFLVVSNKHASFWIKKVFLTFY